MSDTPNSVSADELSLSSIAQGANALISPRNGAGEAPSVLANTGGIISRTGGLLQHTLATVLDVPLAAAEMTLALPNNLIGLATTAVDRAIVRPIDWIRNRIFRLLSTNPFSPSAAPAAMAA